MQNIHVECHYNKKNKKKNRSNKLLTNQSFHQFYHFTRLKMKSI